jgi:DNA-binding HxlR family transcriptional regulator
VSAESKLSPESKPARRVCSVADALSIVGERHALLIVREIGYGNNRFQQIAARTGAPRDVVSVRLKKLEDAGVLERQLYSERPARFEYVLTDAGRELEPILLALKEWGDRYINANAEPVVFQHTCGATFHPVTVCSACNEPVQQGELLVIGGTDAVPGERR